MKRTLTLFGHICQIPDDRIMENLIFGIMKVTGKKERANREWLNDIRDWCSLDIQHMYDMTQDRQLW